MEFKHRENEEINLPDGRTIWLSRSPAVVAVLFVNHVNDQGKFVTSILIEKRSKTMKDAPSKWALPSGYLDWDEDGRQAVRREIYEETGILLDDLVISYQPFYVKTDPKENRQNVALNFGIIIEMGANKMSDELKNAEKFENSEIEEIKWLEISSYKEGIRKKEIKSFDWAFEHDKTIERAILKYRDKINFL